VTSQPGRFSIAATSVRCSRSHASWTTSEHAGSSWYRDVHQIASCTSVLGVAIQTTQPAWM